MLLAYSCLRQLAEAGGEGGRVGGGRNPSMAGRVNPQHDRCDRAVAVDFLLPNY